MKNGILRQLIQQQNNIIVLVLDVRVGLIYAYTPSDGGCSGLNVNCDGDILYIISYCLNCNVVSPYARKKILNGQLTPYKEMNKKIKQIVNIKLQHPDEDIMHLPYSSFL